MTDQEKEVRNLAFCRLAQIYEGTKPMDEPLDVRTIKACIAALPDITGDICHHNAEMRHRAFAVMICKDKLEALLPKPDPAKALVDEFFEIRPTCPGEWHYIDHMCAMVRWLISEGRINV